MNEDRAFKELIIQDIRRFYKGDTNYLLISLRYFFTSSSFRSIFFHRLISSKPIQNHGTLTEILWTICNFFTLSEISYKARIGGGLYLPHPQCIIIGEGCVIGKNVTILQGVTLGGNMGKEKNGIFQPIIADNVLIGPGAKILGPVKIYNNSIIGANSVVIDDIPENSLAVGIPAKIKK